jgi:hypothetical protein
VNPLCLGAFVVEISFFGLRLIAASAFLEARKNLLF